LEVLDPSHPRFDDAWSAWNELLDHCQGWSQSFRNELTDAIVERAYQEYLSGDPFAAQRLARAAKVEKLKHSRGIAVLGCSLIDNFHDDRMQEAFELLKLVLESDPGHALALAGQALWMLAQHDDYPKAFELAECAIKQNPNEPVALLAHFESLYARHSDLRDVETLRKCLDLAPNYLEALGKAAAIGQDELLATAQRRRYYVQIQILAEKYPEEPAAIMPAAQQCQIANEPDKAKQLAQRMRPIDHPFTLNTQGFLHFGLANFDEAAKLFSQARLILKSDATLSANLAEAYAQANQFPQALDVIREAQQSHNDRADLAALRARILQNQQEWSRAIEAWKIAIGKHQGRCPYWHDELALCHNQLACNTKDERVKETNNKAALAHRLTAICEAGTDGWRWACLAVDLGNLARTDAAQLAADIAQRAPGSLPFRLQFNKQIKVVNRDRDRITVYLDYASFDNGQWKWNGELWWTIDPGNETYLADKISNRIETQRIRYRATCRSGSWKEQDKILVYGAYIADAVATHIITFNP